MQGKCPMVGVKVTLRDHQLLLRVAKAHRWEKGRAEVLRRMGLEGARRWWEERKALRGNG